MKQKTLPKMAGFFIFAGWPAGLCWNLFSDYKIRIFWDLVHIVTCVTI